MKQPNFFDFSSNPFLDPKNNPFLDAGKNPFLNNDMVAAFSSMKAPELDMSGLAEAQKRNFEAITAANKTAVEGLQAVFKRQGEILKEITEDVSTLTQGAASIGGPEEHATRNLDAVKSAIEEAVSNVRELSEMTAKSQSEAFDILNQRITESLDEVKSAIAAVKK